MTRNHIPLENRSDPIGSPKNRPEVTLRHRPASRTLSGQTLWKTAVSVPEDAIQQAVLCGLWNAERARSHHLAFSLFGAGLLIEALFAQRKSPAPWEKKRR
jgi:hypothetical protein